MNWFKRLFKRKGRGDLWYTPRKNLIPLSDLSKVTGIKYMTLYMAIRMDRLDAAWDGRVWFSSVDAVEQAIKAGKLRRKDGTKEAN